VTNTHSCAVAVIHVFKGASII